MNLPHKRSVLSLILLSAMATAVSVFGSALGPALSGILIDYEIPFSKQMPFISVFVIICCFLNWIAVNKIKRIYD